MSSIRRPKGDGAREMWVFMFSGCGVLEDLAHPKIGRQELQLVIQRNGDEPTERLPTAPELTLLGGARLWPIVDGVSESEIVDAIVMNQLYKMVEASICGALEVIKVLSTTVIVMRTVGISSFSCHFLPVCQGPHLLQPPAAPGVFCLIFLPSVVCDPKRTNSSVVRKACVLICF